MLRFLLLACAAALVPAVAFAQGAVVQSRPVTPGHAARWVANGTISDAGGAAGGGPGVGLSELGITSNATAPFCITNGVTTGPYNQLCFGVSSSEGAQITLQNYGGASELGFSVNINGTPYTFPQGYSIPLTITETGGMEVQPSGIIVTRNGSVAGDINPLVKVEWTIDQVSNAPNMTFNNTVVNGTPVDGVWANFDDLKYYGGSGAGGGLLTRYVSVNSFTPRAASVPVWAMVLSANDYTNQPSSVAGYMNTIEIDLEASGLDDATGLGSPGRQIVNIVGMVGRNYGGSDTVISSALATAQQGGTAGRLRFKDIVHVGGAFNHSALLIDATPESSAPAVIVNPDASGTIALALKSGSPLVFNYPTNTVNLTWNGETLAVNAPYRIHSSTIADLPSLGAGNNGALLFVTDAKNANGDAAGCTAERTLANTWRCIWSGLAPAP